MEEILKYRTFDQQQNKFSLSGNYILCFEHFDGFSRRMLSISLLVDCNFYFKLEIEDSDRREKYNVEKFRIFLEGKFPHILRENLERFINHSTERIENKFSNLHEGATDQGWQRYIVNIRNSSQLIQVSPELNYNEVKGETKSERFFLTFNQTLNDWLLKIYNEC